MCRFSKPIIWVFMAVWGAGISPLFADEKPGTGRFSLTPFAGYYGTVRLGALLPLPQTADVPGIKVLLEQRSPEGGVSLGYALDRRFELQFTVSTSRVRIMNDIGIGIGGPPLGKKKVSDASLWNLGARLLYGFDFGKISPYFTAGVGAAILDAHKLGTRTRPTFELGAGAHIRLSHRLRAGFELRDAISFFRYFEDFRIFYPMIYSTKTRSVQHRFGARLSLGYFI